MGFLLNIWVLPRVPPEPVHILGVSPVSRKVRLPCGVFCTFTPREGPLCLSAVWLVGELFLWLAWPHPHLSLCTPLLAAQGARFLQVCQGFPSAGPALSSCILVLSPVSRAAWLLPAFSASPQTRALLPVGRLYVVLTLSFCFSLLC